MLGVALLLAEYGLQYKKIELDHNSESCLFVAMAGKNTEPQVYIDAEYKVIPGR